MKLYKWYVLKNFLYNGPNKYKRRVSNKRQFLLIFKYRESITFNVKFNVTITMIGSVVNHLLLRKYETLLNEFYLDPQEEEIIGTFLTLNTNIEIEEPRPRAANKKERKKKTDSNSVVSRDIREMIRNPKKKKEDK